MKKKICVLLVLMMLISSISINAYAQELDEEKFVTDVEFMIQEIINIVINNELVVYNYMLSMKVSCYGVTVNDAERWELEKIIDKLSDKAYNLLIRFEYMNMKFGKYTIKKESLYDLMSNLIKYDKLVNRKNTLYEPRLPSNLYDEIRDVVLFPMGYNLNRLWNSCARDGVWYMSTAICENKSSRCFSRGYNIFINALQKKDIRKKLKR